MWQTYVIALRWPRMTWEIENCIICKCINKENSAIITAEFPVPFHVIDLSYLDKGRCIKWTRCFCKDVQNCNKTIISFVLSAADVWILQLYAWTLFLQMCSTVVKTWKCCCWMDSHCHHHHHFKSKLSLSI